MAGKEVDIASFSMENFFKHMLNEAVAKDKKGPVDDTVIEWNGTRMILPAEPQPMTYREAMQVLADRDAAARQEYSIFERIPGMPFDAAHAFFKILVQRYGWAAATTKQTMFGPQPPRMQIVQTGPNPDDFVEVPVGQFKLHDINSKIETGFTHPDTTNRKAQFMDFFIKGVVNYADRAVVMDLIEATKAYMKKHSIYQGKAMRLSVDSSGQLNELIQPEFIDVSNVPTESLTLNVDVERMLDVALMTPI